MRKRNIEKENIKKRSMGTAPRASYTVEASLILPIYLFMSAIAMKSGLQLYSEVNQAKEQEVQEDFQAVDYFYQVKGISNLSELLKKK